MSNIFSSMNLSPQMFDTIKALVSFEMYEDFLLTNIDKYDKVLFFCQSSIFHHHHNRMIKHWKNISWHILIAWKLLFQNLPFKYFYLFIYTFKTYSFSLHNLLGRYTFEYSFQKN